MLIYTVSPGEYLYSIANQYNLEVEELIRANGLNEIPYLVPGQALILNVEQLSYIIQPGDTISSISRKFNLWPVNSRYCKDERNLGKGTAGT